MELHHRGSAFLCPSTQLTLPGMTEIKFEKSVFLKTLDALSTNFELQSPVGQLVTDKKQSRFQLGLLRVGNIPVQAFGPCTIKGPDVRVNFNIEQLRGQIEATSADQEKVTLHAGAGMLLVA